MATKYRIIGGDGNEYGPIQIDQITSWLREGRLNKESFVAREGDTAWSKISDFAEFSGAASQAQVATPIPAHSAASASPRSFSHPMADSLMGVVKSSASWFWWIAALTGINMVVSLTGTQWGFALGLGICQVFDAMGGEGGGGLKAVAVVLDVIAIGLVALVGWFANKAHSWAFFLGLVLYGIDSIIFIIGFSIIGILIHGLALFHFWKGFAASRELRAAG